VYFYIDLPSTDLLPTYTHNGFGYAVLMASLVLLNLVPRAIASDACTEAKRQINSIGSFTNCLNACLGPPAGKVDVSDAVQCLPDGCLVTVTMSPQSAQRACTLGGCQLPRLVLDCPGLQKDSVRLEHELRLRPSFLLCPVDSVDAHGSFGIDRIEIGQDNEKLKDGQNSFDMMMADIPIPPNSEWKKKQLGEVLSTEEADKNCKLCHVPNGITRIHGLKALLSRDLSPFKNDFNEHLASYVIGSNNPNAHHWDFGTYRGSDGEKLMRLDVVKDKLKPICNCIKDNRDAIKNDEEDKTHAHFPRNQKRMQLGGKHKYPNIDAELNVMTKLCEELDNYMSGLRRSNKRAMVPRTIVHAIGTASMDRGVKSHE
jgi:hypothetical protein